MSRLPDREVLGLLNGESAILDVAREVTTILRDRGIDDAAVVGGVAVYLHGHRRVTDDLDLRVTNAQRLSEVLRQQGFEFDADRREFRKNKVPLHLVTPEQAPAAPREVVEIDGILTVSLPDLIEMKLRSGLEKLTRAQDLADVIALIRVHNLSSEFARSLSKDLQSEFRKLVAAVKEDR